MKKAIFAVTLLAVSAIASAQEIKPEWLHRVWDAAPHNAFTDLTRFKDAWYLSFREAPVHGVPEVGQPGGKIRVLRSADAQKWESVALLDYGTDQDLRDPKLSVAPDGALMIHCAVAPHAQNRFRQSLAYRSTDGKTWGEPVKTGDPGYWMWRVTWGSDKKAYGTGYGPTGIPTVTTRLWRSDDGLNFETLLLAFTSQPGTNEWTIRFRPTGEAIALVRRDWPEDHRGLIGTAPPPYTSWTFQPLPERVGGPNFIVLPDGRLVGAVRRYGVNDARSTALVWLDAKTGGFEPFLTLPSAGDTSYVGLVWHEDALWLSYYSTHEEKSAIYTAKLRLPARQSGGSR